MRVFHFETKPRVGVSIGLSQSGQGRPRSRLRIHKPRTKLACPLSLTDYGHRADDACLARYGVLPYAATCASGRIVRTARAQNGETNGDINSNTGKEEQGG